MMAKHNLRCGRLVWSPRFALFLTTSVALLFTIKSAFGQATTRPSPQPTVTGRVWQLENDWYLEIQYFNTTTHLLQVPRQVREINVTDSDSKLTAYSANFTHAGTDTVTLLANEGFIKRWRLERNFPRGEYSVSLSLPLRFSLIQMPTLRFKVEADN